MVENEVEELKERIERLEHQIEDLCLRNRMNSVIEEVQNEAIGSALKHVAAIGGLSDADISEWRRRIMSNLDEMLEAQGDDPDIEKVCIPHAMRAMKKIFDIIDGRP